MVGRTLPAEWASALERCGGGFFHSPPALQVCAPPGETWFARLLRGGRVAAVAAGTMRRCRLGGMHFYFPTPPAAVGGGEADRGGALAAVLAGSGAGEVVVDSYDAAREGGSGAGAVAARERLEHRVALRADPDELARSFGRTHRRHVARGEREEWTLQPLHGPQAEAALLEAQESASGRAARRGAPFPGTLPGRALASAGGDPPAPWGTTVFAAFAGDDLLAAGLVGWANRRAFYLIGGSTPEGYRRSAAAWLHWRIMAHLATRGHTVYNLGGTPAAAARPGDPSHGLFRFKTGFGGEVVECRGSRWELRPWHLRAHSLAARITGALRR